jgi:branched-chain amino acid transport system substrate-binding protein
MKVGVLYPRSNAHPGMMPDFMDGIKTMLEEQGLNNNIQLVSESIGFGGNEKEVYEKVEKLLVLESADMLVAYVDLRVLEILKPFMYASGKLLLVVNPGANYPLNWVPQPNIVSLTLHHGFLCWLGGKQAASVNTNGLTATTFYDCGYLHTAAMVKGFAKQGGRILFNYVNNQRYDEAFEIKQLTDYLSSDKEANCLLCVFDSLPATLFYSRINEYKDAGRLQLFVSPMMFESNLFEQMKEGFAFTLHGYKPWDSLSEKSANLFFVNKYLEQTKRAATVFSLLGWETALILKQVFQHCNDICTNGTAVAEKLKKISIETPRGEMRLDDETNYFVTPVIKCSVKPHSTKIEMQSLEHLQEQWKEFVKEPIEGATSGWTNTYLCY